MNQPNANAVAEVRSQIDGLLEAMKSKDVDRIMGFYAPQIRAFDAIGPLQFRGVEAYGAHWRACMESCPGEGLFELHEIEVQVGDGLAIAHWLVRCGPDPEQTGWMRGTQAWSKQDGHWRVIHDHWSVPFDMETGRAVFDLLPGERSA